MKKGQFSRTAEAAAALRANHYLNAPNPVFLDPFALELSGKKWQTLFKLPLLQTVLNSKISNQTLGLLTGQVVARSRYTEDWLLEALDNGINQYVLIGAGLDSFALRLAQQYPQLSVYEVDHPDTQQAKIERLKSFGEIPSNVHFVAIDFEKDKIFDALKRSSYNLNKPAFFSWLGTTHYLTPQTTLATLENIAKNAKSNSEISLDYSIHYSDLKGIERIGTFAVGQFTRILSEPLIGSFQTKKLHEAVQQMGFVVAEDLSGDDITQRYFSNRTDGIKHTVATHLLRLIVV